MVSHIEILLGEYDSAVSFNTLAIAADQRTMSSCPSTSSPSSFFVGYVAHDYHMKCFAAMLGGYESESRSAASGLRSLITDKLLHENPALRDGCEAFAPVHVLVLVRFGRWDEVLKLSAFSHDAALMPVTVATILFGRAVALAARGNVDEAIVESNAFNVAREAVRKTKRFLHNNSCIDILDVEGEVLRGEVLYADGKFSDAFSCLRNAVKKEAELNFDEPWGTMIPVRHALGALLLHRAKANMERGKSNAYRPPSADKKDDILKPRELLAEAEAVFRADLVMYPKNPWALTGLIETLELLVVLGGGGSSASSSCDCAASNAATADDEDDQSSSYKIIDELKSTLAASKSSTMYEPTPHNTKFSPRTRLTANPPHPAPLHPFPILLARPAQVRLQDKQLLRLREQEKQRIVDKYYKPLTCLLLEKNQAQKPRNKKTRTRTIVACVLFTFII